ncbi:ribosomal RNA small subunit methyltransferase H [Clostridium acetireducens DSM 10703]|uniref:Ribosomal RNA small subunit methyltransferase H n=1 Tax=Clostridium acetireducens DSM 10703 TaxID=1121290 RepID=A0A1E8F1P7_9CLOT|nr:16S rRNA (cytosine(1402)-N(4))-methyltransferase RsmH [Clostridium acetireducens]OFI07545.1 ribosomal RNA small subunit methyltransferase H [Clostridium acetireducens DSM 10703]
MDFKHISVLLNETIDGLNIKPEGVYVDCTLGGGGHSREILKRLSEKGTLIGIDQDSTALEVCRERFKEYSNVIYVHNNFYNIDTILNNLNIEKVDGVIMDLGVSSYQLDTAERGFSYMKDAPLDMRMDRDNDISAFNVINNYSEEELTNVIKKYGEEKFAKRISRKIVERRKKTSIDTTIQLVDIIKEAIPVKFQKKGHPAKKTFQAIRIEVNRELKILNKAIEDSVNHLNSEGRISIITFHSLEDRIVKNKFRELENPCTCPPDFPICVCGKKPILKIINKKPVEPSEYEKQVNSRSKSAKLRIGEKI